MLKRFFQIGLLILLCLLLVYAPEIFTAVSAPYRLSTEERVLLRVVLCTEDADSAASFYQALAPFRKAHGSVHLRVTRADAGQMLSLPEPLPDVYVFPASLSLSPERLFLSLGVGEEGEGVWDGVRYARVYTPEKGEPLLCAAGAHARVPDAALAFLEALCAEAAAP